MLRNKYYQNDNVDPSETKLLLETTAIKILRRILDRERSSNIERRRHKWITRRQGGNKNGMITSAEWRRIG